MQEDSLLSTPTFAEQDAASAITSSFPLMHKQLDIFCYSPHDVFEQYNNKKELRRILNYIRTLRRLCQLMEETVAGLRTCAWILANVNN